MINNKKKNKIINNKKNKIINNKKNNKNKIKYYRIKIQQ